MQLKLRKMSPSASVPGWRQAHLGGVVSSEGHVRPPANTDTPFPGLWTHCLHF